MTSLAPRVDEPSAPAPVPVALEVDEPPAPMMIRSTTDGIRLAIALVALLGAIFTARFGADGVRGFERDLLRLSDEAPRPVQNTVVAAIQLAALYSPLLLLVVMLVLRRFRRLGIVAATAVVTALVLRGVTALIGDALPRSGPIRIEALGLHIGFRNDMTFPNLGYVAIAAAVAAVELPWLTRAWRRAVVVIIVAVAYAHLATIGTLPVDIGVAVTVGLVMGFLARLVFGRPNGRPGGVDLAASLARSGIRLVRITAGTEHADRSRPYHAVDDEGGRIFIKSTYGADRGGDVLSRLYRYIRFRHVGDENPLWSVGRVAEHEALMSFTARAAGVATPSILAVSDTGTGHLEATVIALEEVVGARPLSGLAPDELTDEQLRETWANVARLRTTRLAHRDLKADNLLLDADGHIWVVDFGTAQAQADRHVLANDVAELLCSLAVRNSPERVVRTAVDVLGTEAVASAVPRLQPLALTAETRAEVRAIDGDFLADLAARACDCTNAEQITYEQLQRVKPRTIFIFVMSAFAVYALLPQLAHATDVFGELGNASWPWVLGAVVASGLSYLAATVALTGSVPDRIPFGRTAVAQVATQFANFATPASVGGMALNVRYVQKQGTDPPVAVAAVGLNAVTGVVVHLGLLAAAVLVAGNDETSGFELPSASTALKALGILIVVMAIVLAVPAGRKLIVERCLPIVRRSVSGIVEIAKRPAKLAELVGGSLLVTLCYVAALVASVAAFGGDLPIVTVAAVFLVAATVASAAPTPGGLGAVEAALIAGLTGVGLNGAIAVSAVVVFRFATFWIPLAPGWFSFHLLERRQVI